MANLKKIWEMSFFKNMVKHFLNREKKSGVAINARNFPGTPQFDELDFFDIPAKFCYLDRGSVYIKGLSKISSFGGQTEAGSSAPCTNNFDAKKWFKMSAFSLGSVTTCSSSIICEIWEVLLFFVSLDKIQIFLQNYYDCALKTLLY